ncbi:hypothetical protein C2138_03215 [Salinibacterium hongtaonis]|nr:hypothetical protein C2138_03215 [Salinibacterium hongtaonis]
MAAQEALFDLKGAFADRRSQRFSAVKPDSRVTVAGVIDDGRGEREGHTADGVTVGIADGHGDG